jgi:hypothetical protein
MDHSCEDEIGLAVYKEMFTDGLMTDGQKVIAKAHHVTL